MPNRPVDDPILAYNADGEINNLQWSASQPDWVSIAFKDKLQICKFNTSKIFMCCLFLIKKYYPKTNKYLFRI